jgi:hypothetical protein
MKSIALFSAIALIPAITAQARTINTTESGTSAKSVAGVAGPATAARNSGPSDASPADQALPRHAGKKTLKKTKVTPPPPMHDPN